MRTIQEHREHLERLQTQDTNPADRDVHLMIDASVTAGRIRRTAWSPHVQKEARELAKAFDRLSVHPSWGQW